MYFEVVKIVLNEVFESALKNKQNTEKEEEEMRINFLVNYG